MGYVTTQAEREARENIKKAVEKVLNIFWKEQQLTNEEREELSDDIGNLYLESYKHLDDYVYMLHRVPPNLSEKNRIAKKLRLAFADLAKYVKTKPKYVYNPVKNVLRKVGLAQIFTREDYLGEIENSDLDILAETILVGSKTKRKAYVVTHNERHFGSQSAVIMLEKEWDIYVRKPADMLNIVDKRYRNI